MVTHQGIDKAIPAIYYVRYAVIKGRINPHPNSDNRLIDNSLK